MPGRRCYSVWFRSVCPRPRPGAYNAPSFSSQPLQRGRERRRPRSCSPCTKQRRTTPTLRSRTQESRSGSPYTCWRSSRLSEDIRCVNPSRARILHAIPHIDELELENADTHVYAHPGNTHEHARTHARTHPGFSGARPTPTGYGSFVLRNTIRPRQEKGREGKGRQREDRCTNLPTRGRILDHFEYL